MPFGLTPQFSPEYALRALLKALAATLRQVVEADGDGGHYPLLGMSGPIPSMESAERSPLLMNIRKISINIYLFFKKVDKPLLHDNAILSDHFVHVKRGFSQVKAHNC